MFLENYFDPKEPLLWSDHTQMISKENITTMYLLYMADLTVSQHRQNGMMQAYSGIYGNEEKALVIAIDKNEKKTFEPDFQNYINTLKEKNNDYLRFKEELVIGDDKFLLVMELKEKGKVVMDTVWEGKYTKLPIEYKKVHFCPECPSSVFKKHVVNNNYKYREQWAKRWGLPDRIAEDETIEMEAKPTPYKDVFGHPFDLEIIQIKTEDLISDSNENGL